MRLGMESCILLFHVGYLVLMMLLQAIGGWLASGGSHTQVFYQIGQSYSLSPPKPQCHRPL